LGALETRNIPWPFSRPGFAKKQWNYQQKSFSIEVHIADNLQQGYCQLSGRSDAGSFFLNVLGALSEMRPDLIG